MAQGMRTRAIGAKPAVANDSRTNEGFAMTTMIHGACHCGNITFDLGWPVPAVDVPARACTCAFCTKHGAVWTAHRDATLSVRVADVDAVTRYAFETRTAAFHVCRRCGVVALCTSEIAGRIHAVVNVNTFDDFDITRLDRRPVTFDGESEAERLQRRAAHWIARVTG